MGYSGYSFVTQIDFWFIVQSYRLLLTTSPPEELESALIKATDQSFANDEAVSKRSHIMANIVPNTVYYAMRVTVIRIIWCP